jgi:uncharacterized protein (TIGR03083 family)
MHVEVDDYIAALSREGSLLGDAAEEAGLTAPVPTCPGWQVRDLVRHQAFVHDWAGRHVREQSLVVLGDPGEEAILASDPPDGELLAAYRAGLAELVRTLREADPAVRCAMFMPGSSPLAFWARRQAHETAIHRLDAESALPARQRDPAGEFTPSFAEDGIDELIMGFAARQRYRMRTDDKRTLTIRTTDTGACWLVSAADGVTAVSRGSADSATGDTGDTGDTGGTGGTGECVLDGPASGLYVFLWNRAAAEPARVTVAGDQNVIDSWRSDVRVLW